MQKVRAIEQQSTLWNSIVIFMFRAIMYKLYSDTGYDGDFEIVQNISNYENTNKQLIIMYKKPSTFCLSRFWIFGEAIQMNHWKWK